MRVLFLTDASDPASALVPRLGEVGIDAAIINGEPPPPHAIALFTLYEGGEAGSDKKSAEPSSRHLRMGPRRLGTVPDWAQKMALQVGVRPGSLKRFLEGTESPHGRGHLFEALRGARDLLEPWDPISSDEIPWIPCGLGALCADNRAEVTAWKAALLARAADTPEFREDPTKDRRVNIPVEKRRVGEWTVQFAGDNPVTIDSDVRGEIEDLLERYVDVAMPMYMADYPTPTLAMTRLGVPAPVVRLDMPPATDGFRGICEVESNVSGLGLAGLLGVQVAEPIARCLLDHDITSVAFGAFGSRGVQGPELRIFMEQMADQGIETTWIDNLFDSAVDQMPLWLRAGNEDLGLVQPRMGQALLCHYDGGGHKRYLLGLDDAVVLSDVGPKVNTILERYPEGFALKPVGGWGTREVHILATSGPSRTYSLTSDRMQREIDTIWAAGDQANWLVQVYRSPEVVKRDLPGGGSTRECRIWRCYAVWNGERYELVGGFWAQRKSLMVHGASDCIIGPLHV